MIEQIGLPVFEQVHFIFIAHLLLMRENQMLPEMIGFPRANVHIARTDGRTDKINFRVGFAPKNQYKRPTDEDHMLQA